MCIKSNRGFWRKKQKDKWIKSKFYSEIYHNSYDKSRNTKVKNSVMDKLKLSHLFYILNQKIMNLFFVVE